MGHFVVWKSPTCVQYIVKQLIQNTWPQLVSIGRVGGFIHMGQLSWFWLCSLSVWGTWGASSRPARTASTCGRKMGSTSRLPLWDKMYTVFAYWNRVYRERRSGSRRVRFTSQRSSLESGLFVTWFRVLDSYILSTTCVTCYDVTRKSLHSTITLFIKLFIWFVVFHLEHSQSLRF